VTVFNYYAWFVRGKEHAAMCRTSVEAVKRADPHSRCLVVTDEVSPAWDIPNAAVSHIGPGMPIMLANLEAQVSALAAAWTDGAESITFLDTDTLLLKPVPVMGDITFTWRDSIGTDDDGEKVEGIASRMPYNYGVIVARPCIRAFESFIWMRERIRGMHANHQSWYGNQLAAAELGGRRPQSGSTIDPRPIPWRLTNVGKTVNVGKIPCTEYNWTPQSPNDSLDGKYVAHFKGGKRHLMEWYAKRMGLGWYVEAKPKLELPNLAMVASL